MLQGWSTEIHLPILLFHHRTFWKSIWMKRSWRCWIPRACFHCQRLKVFSFMHATNTCEWRAKIVSKWSKNGVSSLISILIKGTVYCRQTRLLFSDAMLILSWNRSSSQSCDTVLNSDCHWLENPSSSFSPRLLPLYTLKVPPVSSLRMRKTDHRCWIDISQVPTRVSKFCRKHHGSPGRGGIPPNLQLYSKAFSNGQSASLVL